MREPPSDQSERDNDRCCISSDAKGRTLVTSFPPLVHSVSARPIPERFYRFEGFDSDNIGSALAQVGRALSPVPSSQKVENGRWRNWLGQPSSVISSHVAVEGSQVSIDHRVSPGVSEIRRPERNPPLSLPSKEDLMPPKSTEVIPSEPRGLNKLPSSSDSSEILSRYEEFVSRLRRLEHFDTPEIPPSPTEHSIGVDAEIDMPAHLFDASEESMMFISGAGIHEEDKLPTEGVETQCQESVTTSDAHIHHPESILTCRSSPLPPLAAQPAPTESEGIDLDEAWKTFVFGDEGSDEVGKAVFKEARHDAARRMRPSDSSAYLEDSPESESNSNIATIGTLYANDNNETSDSTENPSPTGVSAKATYGHSSIGPGPGSLHGSGASAEAPSVEANAGTSIPSGAESNTDSPVASGPRSGEIVESSTPESLTGPPSLTTSMAVVPARSDVGVSEPGTSGEQFRFVPPKLFVGSRSNDGSQLKRGTEVGVGISLTRRRRGRPRKRANDGRADIRALPNYSSDPIEEVEDEERPPTSIFPALELARGKFCQEEPCELLDIGWKSR